MQLDARTTVHRRTDVITEAVNEDVVVLDPETSRFVRLNGTAAALWDALAAAPASLDLLTGVLERRGAPADRAHDDALAFVGAMSERGLVRLSAP